MKLKNWWVLVLLVGVGLFVASQKMTNFQSETDGILLNESVENYAELVYQNYRDSRITAENLLQETQVFVKSPVEAGLLNLRNLWKTARSHYNPTETYRFYGGPIDHAQTGVEGLLNAWPLDEAYIDYVQEDGKILWTGLINDESFEITKKNLLLQNERDGEKNISTGYHAIEFLLWGQDFNQNSAGTRSAKDFQESTKNSDRRKAYLVTVTELLVDHLKELEAAWAPEENNYRKTFVAQNPKKSLSQILTGLITFSGNELSGERMYVAYDTRSQEDEQSCFSDTTHLDIIQNIEGMNTTFETTFAPLLKTNDQSLLSSIQNQFKQALGLAKSIPAPLDQVIVATDNESEARINFLRTVQSLRSLSKLFENIAPRLGLELRGVEGS